MLKHCCFDCINTNCSTILVYKSILHEGNQVATKSAHTQEMVIMILEWKKKDSSQLPIKRLRSCTISTQPY